MVRWLLLGCGPVGHAMLEMLAERSGRVQVITDDPERVTSLREEGVRAIHADPTNPESYPTTAELILVVGEDAGRNLAAVESARRRYPDAQVTTYAGVDADPEFVERLHASADRVVDATSVLTDHVVGMVDHEPARRLRRLLTVLRELDGPLAVVTHDNPDPDAIASAVALCRIAETVGVEADACYFGEISHQENRALVNLLDLQLRNLESNDDLEPYAGIALVDHSRPGVNDGLDPETLVDIVIDHHPPRAPVEARFVDLRSEVGATSTLLADYLERLGRDLDRTVATALLYGIRVDTKDFTREVSKMDFEATAYLLERVDASVLERVETPSMSADVFETIARAIRNREVRGTALASCVGKITDRDALAQAAERLLDMEGVEVSLVYGFEGGTVYVSGRARGTDIDLGETLRDALGQIGSAGGHADMAGAQLPLGILENVEDDAKEPLTEVVRGIVSGRFFETLDTAPSLGVGDTEELTLEFPIDERN
ncbi:MULTISPECIES: DHH family phosphoesterase [Haloprofundus]|uniref:DHH family phosphoesterase n=1 Tax=Haloprofundus TaxID=1911573 RepID=UPI000E449CCD|nr:MULTISPECIES: DHH family phosphoesterase [Haloprofundus]QCJ47903.1 bifunctional oligoribonuclease/PAP phosphatase NrnA [Haloprofundus sp. MHR1]